MSCCIPDCSNLRQEWTTEFPRDKELMERWMAAIHAGTGRNLADENIQKGGQICDMHFAVEQRNGYCYEYLEPSLFVRDAILLQVTSCRLCLRYDTIDSMYEKEYCLAPGQSLQRLVNKYYKIAPSRKKSEDEEYFCESCTIRIDMTHTFWQELSDGVKEFEKLFKKMQKAKSLLINAPPGTAQIKQEVLPTNNIEVNERPTDLMEDTIVKEEPRLQESENDVQLFDGQDNESSDESQAAKQSHPSLFKCYICYVNLESKDTLIQHLVASHAKEQTYRCGECNLSFKQITGYNIHLSKHDINRAFKCNVCSIRFNKNTARKYHEASKHGIDNGKVYRKDRVRKRQTCLRCGKICATKMMLNRHELKQHGSGSEGFELKDYKCEICSKLFTTVRSLERHLTIHRNEKSFRCEQCDSCFRRKDQLLIHLRLHTGEKPLVCSGCGEGFAVPVYLYRHKKRCPAFVSDSPNIDKARQA